MPIYPAPAPSPAPPGYYGTYEASSYPPKPPRSTELPSRGKGPGAEEHEGFFLRLTLGVGAALSNYREAVDGVNVSDVTTRGIAGFLGVSVGGHVGHNFIIHGDLLASAVGDADKNVDGVRDASNTIDGSMGLLGGGATYYFMPMNVYVSAIVGAASLSESRDGELAIDTSESSVGFGAAVLVGKEWWVGRRAEWGVGAALRGTYFTAPVDIAGAESRMRGADVGLAFSATCN